MVFSGSGRAPCGFWISDPEGKDFEEFEDQFVPGFRVELSAGPFQFDARKPHCGRDTSRDHARISVAVFLLKRKSEPCLETRETLRTLGFNVPDPNMFRGETTVSPDNPPANQTTLHLFFKTTGRDRQQWAGLRSTRPRTTTQAILDSEASSITPGQRTSTTKREDEKEEYDDDDDEVLVIEDDPLDPTEVTGEDDDVVGMVDTL